MDGKITHRMISLSNGNAIPCIGMGTFGSDKYNPKQVSDAVAHALVTGWRLFDCASVYGNEAQIGEVFANAFKEGIVRREELHITSKVWNDMHGMGDVLLSLAKTLKDLRLDYIDSYFVHWPFPNYHAPGCAGDARNPDSKPFSTESFMSVWRQMERLKYMGLVKNIGMSNMTIPKLEAVLPLCEIKPSLIEMEMHPAFQQTELFDYCVRHGIQPVGYCPLGSPSRPERDRVPGDVSDMELDEVLEVAGRHNIHPALVCLKWSVQRGAIPIPFSVSPEKIESNLRCITQDPLTEEDMALLKKADRGCRLVKGQVFLWPSANDWCDLWDELGKITK